MNREALILIKVHYVIYKWIRLDMLYKLVKPFFFKFRNHFLNGLQFFKIILELGLCMQGGEALS